MANFNDIKHEIDQNVNTNGVQAITGAILNQTLKDMLDDVDSQKQDTLVAGQNITISGNVISATGGGSGPTYTAGQGIDISQNNVISVNPTGIAGQGLLNDGEGHLKLDPNALPPTYAGGFGIDITTGPDVIAVDASDLAGFGLTTDGNGNLAVDTNTIASQNDLANKQDTLTFNLPININPGDNSIELLYGDGLTMGVGDALAASLGNGLQFDANGAIEVDTNTVATQQDLTTKQDALTAGDGVEIDQNNEISVKAGSGLGFDSNGYLINTGGGGGGTTYTAGDGIEIDSSDAINAKLGNGLQLDQNNNIEIDPSVVATQNDLAGKQDTLTAGNGIDIDSNNVISVDPSDLAGNGLQVNQSGYLEPDFNVVASQSDLLGKQDTLVAGTNITIQGNVISATGGGQSYSAGSGIDITNNVISVDNTIATQSDLLGKQDTLVAGANIQINGNTISATDTNTTYSAGNGLNLNGTTFSVDTNAIQEKLTAGTGISINGTTISATGGGGGSYSAGDGINIDSNNTISVDASDLAGAGLLSDLNNNLSVDANDLAGNGLRVDSNGRLEVVGGGGGSLWTTGAGTESRISSPNIAGTAAGDYAIAGGFNPTATGDYSFAFGNRPTVSGDNGVAIGYQPTAGIGSVALGYVANASGQNSFAAGHNVSATGLDSTAIGPGATASGGYSVAIGNAASATGTGSVAIGSGTQTTTSFEQAFGKYNLSNNSASDDAATAYTIGNGTSNGARSNSIEIKKNDDIYVVGVGGYDGTNASSSQTLQDVINNGGGGGNYLPLEGGTLQADQSYNDTILDINSPTRRSNISLDSYDNLDPNDPQGTATITMTDTNGYIQIKPNGISDGTYTASWPTLSADDTIALLSDIPAGLWESGSGNGSIKNVEAASANGDHAFVAGYNAHADGNYSVALGARANASYSNAFAIGADAVASQSHAFAIGKDANSSASYAYAIGRDASSSASYAYAIGRSVQATNQNEVGLGVYNKSTTGSTSDDNSKFTIGNGTGNAARSNVLEIKENGDAYLYGVGGFTGANTSAATTLQDVINNGGGGSSYSAGSGIDITNNTISVDTTTIQEKLTAGSNITISGNVISATGGGASYSAGSGINIDANNVISNTAPDPGLWVAGTVTGSIKSANAGSATGRNCIVIGYNSTSSAVSAITLGASATSASSNSVAIGHSSYSDSGSDFSVALGRGANTRNDSEIGIGKFNNSISTGTTAEKTQFTVGNGSSGSARSNLIEAKQNNDLYIYGVGSFDGTNASSASTLQTVLSGKQDTLTAGSGITISGNTISATGGGGGSCLWSPSTGTNSLISPGAATGVSSDAAGTGAITVGYDSTADGAYAFAQGGASVASGDYSFAANNGTASGDYSAAFSGSGAYGANSFAAGGGSGAHADYSVALGGGNVVFDDQTDPQNPINAQYGVAIGDASVVEGEYGLAFMGGTASGSHSVAIGDAASASEMYSTALTGSTSQGNYSFAASTGVAAGHYSSALSGGHAQGEGSFASGFNSSAHGYCSAALGYALSTYSQADGTTSSDPNAGEVALGRYNYSESGIIFSIGCGYYDSEVDQEVRQNSVAIDSDGKIYLKGLGGYTGQSVSGCTDLVSFLNNL